MNKTGEKKVSVTTSVPYSLYNAIKRRGVKFGYLIGLGYQALDGHRNVQLILDAQNAAIDKLQKKLTNVNEKLFEVQQKQEGFQ
jgi:hypothetical protein